MVLLISFQSLRNFCGNAKFREIDVECLKRYELWMLNNGRKRTTVGIYLRALRKIFNATNRDGIIKKEKCYPFGLEKYVIPEPAKRKNSLQIEQVQQIFYYEPENEDEAKARDFWLFLYLGNGMNMKDVCCLQYKNVQDEFIVFERQKTKNTNRKGLPISVYITGDLQNIIERWGNKDKDPENYIFPILEQGMTALEIHHKKQDFTRYVNDWMDKIKPKLGIEKKTNTSMARSTYATTMRHAGVPREFVKDAMGHKLLKTLDHYYDSFEDEIKKEFTKKLTPFKVEDRLVESDAVTELA